MKAIPQIQAGTGTAPKAARAMPPSPVPPPPNPIQFALNSNVNGVLPSGTYERFSAVVTRGSQLIGDAAARPIIRFFGSAEGKGGILVKGADLLLENLELWEAYSSSSGNGAAIRLEATPLAANGVPSNLTCRNVAFRFNENGILGPDLVRKGGRIALYDCEFDRNGNGGTGLIHGAYISSADELIVERCYFHDTFIGHELKSRALKNVVRDSRFGSVTSRCSYELEFPYGGDVLVENCTFIQSPLTDNTFVLGYGAEWSAETNAPVNQFIVRNCVLWNFHREGFIARINPAIQNANIVFENCTFINFTQVSNATFAPSTIVSRGAGNRVLTLAQAYAIYPDGPRLTEANLAPLVGKADLATMPARQWRRIDGTRIDQSIDLSVLPTHYLPPAFLARNVIDTWGGGTLRADEMIFNGTGHGGGHVNARAAFNFKTLSWRWASPQSPAAITTQASPYGSDLPVDPNARWHVRPLTPQESNKSKVSFPDGSQGVFHGQYPDGFPAPSHGWTNAFTLPDGRFGDFWLSRDVRIFDPTVGRWEFIPSVNIFQNTYSTHVQVDALTNRLYASVNYFDLMEYDAKTFAYLGKTVLTEFPLHSCVVEREIWYFCRKHGEQLLRFNLDTKAVQIDALKYPLSHAGQHFSDGAGCVFVKEIGAVIRIDRVGQAFAVDVATLMCEPFSLGAALPVSMNGIWRRIWTDQGRLFALPAGGDHVWVSKL